ncbi:MAG: amidase [Acidimicrobiales bacterium]
MTTFITRFDTRGPGLRLAVKDLIDMEGVPTTAGCRAVADEAENALKDATCLAGARAAGARIVGRTNLNELALGVTGVNPWFGTPINPLDPARVPGGSSSGSAVSVATGEADVAYGTDTGGSVRIPSACCGTAGLKTTWGRVPLDGVRPLAPTLDTVGPMARDVRGLVAGMQMLEPGFQLADVAPTRVGRVRLGCDPRIESALDSALAAAGWEVVDVDVAEWEDANSACGVLVVAEAWQSNQRLARRYPERIGPEVLQRLQTGRDVGGKEVASARATARRWQARLSSLFGEVDLLVTPTLTIFPPFVERAGDLVSTRARCTFPANLAGVPALALPVPSSGPLPASLQLMGPAGSEERLLAAGLVVETAVGVG